VVEYHSPKSSSVPSCAAPTVTDSNASLIAAGFDYLLTQSASEVSRLRLFGTVAEVWTEIDKLGNRIHREVRV
jgi:hypothetical protein